jgi:hypothetical protein
MAPETDASLLVRDDSFLLGTWRPVFTVLWRRRPDVERARTMVQEFRRFLSGQAGGVAVLVVIEAGTPPPDAMTRDLITDAMRVDAARNRGIAYVLEGTGFASAAMRGVITGTLLVVRPPYPTRVFATIEGSAPWIVSKLSPAGFDALALVVAMSRMRAGNVGTATAIPTSPSRTTTATT